MIRLQVLLVSPSSLDVPVQPRSYLPLANFSQYRLNVPRITLNDLNPNSSELSFQTSVAANRIFGGELQQQRQYILNSENVRKFLHFTKVNGTLQDLFDEIMSKIAKMYPSVQDQVEIDTLQDTSGCDLDPDFIVGDIFNFDNVVRVILKKDIDWSEVGPVSKYEGLKRRKLDTGIERTPGQTMRNTRFNEQNSTNSCFDPNFNFQRRKSLPAKRSSLRMSTTLSNQIYPDQSKNADANSLDANDRLFLPPPSQPQSPSIRISSGIESSKRIVNPAESDIVSNSELVDPDKSRQQLFMDTSPHNNSSGMPILTGQRVTSTSGTNHLSFFQDTGADVSRQPLQTPVVNSGTLRLPEAKLSRTRRQSTGDTENSPRSSVPKKVEIASMKKTPQGNITGDLVLDGVNGNQVRSPTTQNSSDPGAKSPVTVRNGNVDKIKESPRVIHRPLGSIADNNGSPIYNGVENEGHQMHLAELPELKKPLSNARRGSTTIESTIRASISQQKRERQSVTQLVGSSEGLEATNRRPLQDEKNILEIKGKDTEEPDARKDQATLKGKNAALGTKGLSEAGRHTAPVETKASAPDRSPPNSKVNVTTTKSRLPDPSSLSPRTISPHVGNALLSPGNVQSSQDGLTPKGDEHSTASIETEGGELSEKNLPEKAESSSSKDNVTRLSISAAQEIRKSPAAKVSQFTKSEKNPLSPIQIATSAVSVTKDEAVNEGKASIQLKPTEKNFNSPSAEIKTGTQVTKGVFARDMPSQIKKGELIDMLEDGDLNIPSWLLDDEDSSHRSRHSPKKKPYTTVRYKDIDNSKPDPRNILPERTKRSTAKRAVRKMTDHSLTRAEDIDSDTSSSSEDDSLDTSSTYSSSSTGVESYLLYDNGGRLRQIKGLSDLRPSKRNTATTGKFSTGNMMQSRKDYRSDNASTKVAQRKYSPTIKGHETSSTTSATTADPKKADTELSDKSATGAQSSMNTAASFASDYHTKQSHNEFAGETDSVEDSSMSEDSLQDSIESQPQSKHSITRSNLSGDASQPTQKDHPQAEDTPSGAIPLTQMLSNFSVSKSLKPAQHTSTGEIKIMGSSQTSTSAGESTTVNKVPQSAPNHYSLTQPNSSSAKAEPGLPTELQATVKPGLRRGQVNAGKSRPARKKAS